MTETHIVLVHGGCHGAWCWYKVKPRLEAAGHRVTALDMAASGVNAKSIHDVLTAREYSEPLLEFMGSLPDGHKVVLVGHSSGGTNLALAMELFPRKISLAVFLTAFMPDTVNKPSHVFDQFISKASEGFWMDTEFMTYGPPSETGTTMLFGPHFSASNFYQLSPIEDMELCKALMRPSSLFLEDLQRAEKYTDGNYGSVKRVYIVCKDDRGITEEFQKWMIENSSGCAEVVEIDGADHMIMFSKPQELSECITVLAKTHC